MWSEAYRDFDVGICVLKYVYVVKYILTNDMSPSFYIHQADITIYISYTFEKFIHRPGIRV